MQINTCSVKDLIKRYKTQVKPLNKSHVTEKVGRLVAVAGRALCSRAPRGGCQLKGRKKTTEGSYLGAFRDIRAARFPVGPLLC